MFDSVRRVSLRSRCTALWRYNLEHNCGAALNKYICINKVHSWTIWTFRYAAALAKPNSLGGVGPGVGVPTCGGHCMRLSADSTVELDTSQKMQTSPTSFQNTD
jgi:hypothetical protein